MLEQQWGALWTSRLCPNSVKRSSRDLTCFCPSHLLPSTCCSSCCPCLDSRRNSSPPLGRLLFTLASPASASLNSGRQLGKLGLVYLQSRELNQANTAEMRCQNVHTNCRGSSCPFMSSSGLPCLTRVSSRKRVPISALEMEKVARAFVMFSYLDGSTNGKGNANTDVIFNKRFVSFSLLHALFKTFWSECFFEGRGGFLEITEHLSCDKWKFFVFS